MFLIQSGSFGSSPNQFGILNPINNNIVKQIMTLFFTFTLITSFHFRIANFSLTNICLQDNLNVNHRRPSRGIELLSEDPQSSILTTVLRGPRKSKNLHLVIIFDFNHDENYHVCLLSTNLFSRYEILVDSHGNCNRTYLCWCNLSYALALILFSRQNLVKINDRFKFVVQCSCST